jgi:hypothetical protein
MLGFNMLAPPFIAHWSLGLALRTDSHELQAMAEDLIAGGLCHPVADQVGRQAGHVVDPTAADTPHVIMGLGHGIKPGFATTKIKLLNFARLGK